MKTITTIIERNEDSYFAYIDEIEGCVAGGSNYAEVKSNLEEILEIYLEEDEELRKKYLKGYEIEFEVA